MLKKTSQDQIPPCHTVILFAGSSVGKGPFKIQGTKKAMEGSGENRHYLENPVSSLNEQNSFSSSFSLFSSPVPFRHILTSSGKKQNNLKENGGKCSNIHHREVTHMLAYLDSMYVLQGWEHFTSASLGKDAKSIQVKH